MKLNRFIFGVIVASLLSAFLVLKAHSIGIDGCACNPCGCADCACSK